MGTICILFQNKINYCIQKAFKAFTEICDLDGGTVGTVAYHMQNFKEDIVSF